MDQQSVKGPPSPIPRVGYFISQTILPKDPASSDLGELPISPKS